MSSKSSLSSNANSDFSSATSFSAIPTVGAAESKYIQKISLVEVNQAILA